MQEVTFAQRHCIIPGADAAKQPQELQDPRKCPQALQQPPHESRRGPGQRSDSPLLTERLSQRSQCRYQAGVSSATVPTPNDGAGGSGGTTDENGGCVSRREEGKGSHGGGGESRALGEKLWLFTGDSEERVLTVLHGNKFKRPSRERKLDERPDALAGADDRLHLVRRVADEVGVPGDRARREGGDDGRAAACEEEVSARVDATGQSVRRTRRLCAGRHSSTKAVQVSLRSRNRARASGRTKVPDLPSTLDFLALVRRAHDRADEHRANLHESDGKRLSRARVGVNEGDCGAEVSGKENEGEKGTHRLACCG